MARAAEEMAALQWQHHPHLCPLQVPKIMTCIHKNLERINMKSAQQSMESLLPLLTDQDPMEVVLSLLKFSPPGNRYWPQKP